MERDSYALDHKAVEAAANVVANEILANDALSQQGIFIYPVPRGGVPAAYMVFGLLCEKVRYQNVQLVDDPRTANVIIDDLIDSGTTLDLYTSQYPKAFFYALFTKYSSPIIQQKHFGHEPLGNEWVTFPWENAEGNAVASSEDIGTRIIQFIGEDVKREGLKETPTRFSKALRFWTKGYDQDAGEVLKVFEDGGENYDEMVLVKDIPVYSLCEHHMASIFGVAHVGYIPNGRICGLSKLNRVVDVFARRLQVQERLTVQIADALQEHLQPTGVAVQLVCRHMCMESRGVCQQGHKTVTTALRGVYKDDLGARQEFFDSTRIR